MSSYCFSYCIGIIFLIFVTVRYSSPVKLKGFETKGIVPRDGSNRVYIILKCLEIFATPRDHRSFGESATLEKYFPSSLLCISSHNLVVFSSITQSKILCSGERSKHDPIFLCQGYTFSTITSLYWSEERVNTMFVLGGVMEEFHKHSGAFCLCLKITTLYDKTIYTKKLLPKNENRVLPLHHSCTALG